MGERPKAFPRDLVRAYAAGLLVAALSAVVGYAAAGSARRVRRSQSPWERGVPFATEVAAFRVFPGTGALTVRALDRTSAADVVLELVVDGLTVPLEVPRDGLLSASADELSAHVPVPTDDGPRTAAVHVALDRELGALRLDAHLEGDVAHALALRARLPLEGHTLFVDGIGEVGDLAEVRGRYALLDVEPHPLAFVAAGRPLGARVFGAGASDLAVEIESPPAHGESTRLDVVLGRTPGAVYAPVLKLAGVPARPLEGVVTGSADLARVLGLDADGRPLVRLSLPRGGPFALSVPQDAVGFYAVVDQTRSSELVPLTSDTKSVRLDVSPGGSIDVSVVDADGGAAITTRLVVRGRDGTPDPSFGPDYRASGAGPLMDALRGRVLTPLPPGAYRVLATKGFEWTIDARDIVVESGGKTRVELALRHVGATPGRVGCDLHVHARPSFDAPVTPEDRVLSLVAAGVQFAVPTEHNIVGDYGPALSLLGLGAELLWVPGVEVTTYAPRLGHFGVFPYPPGPVPPYKGTTVAAVAAAARAGDPRRVFQLNHPRLPGGIGYFQLRRFEPKKAKELPRRVFLDFDAMEVYNGYDLGFPARVDAVLSDWFALLNKGVRMVATGSSDAHRIQYHWAGYPRTFVDVEGATNVVDAPGVVAALKAGHATVSTGPLVDVRLLGAKPGDEVDVRGETASLAVRVRAVPWIDVTRIDVVVDGRVARSVAVASRPTFVGREDGSLAEAQARSVRFDGLIDVPLPNGDAWIVVVVRGERRFDDVLPFMPVTPMAITNPIFVRRSGAPWRGITTP